MASVLLSANAIVPGGTIVVTIHNGPGTVGDWVALNLISSLDAAYFDWFYLNGTKVLPLSGLPEATIRFTVPSVQGSYHIRFYLNDSWTKLVTSPTFRVALVGEVYNYRIEGLLGALAFTAPGMVGSTNWIGGALGWADLTLDTVGAEDVVVEYGISGNSPLDRTANTGQLSYGLNNDKSNSAKKLGYYSPFNSQKRVGFDYNIPIRLVLTHGGLTTYKFYGSLAEIIPTIEEFHLTHCRALDIFDDWAKIDEPELPLQVEKRGNEIMNALLDAMSTQPRARSFEVGAEVFPVALDGGTGQKMKVRERIDQINRSEFGYCYPVGDTTGGGTIRWESRHHRAANPTVMFTLDESDLLYNDAYQVAGTRDDYYRSISVSVHPTNDVRIAIVGVLFALETTQTLVHAGETNDTIFGPFRDPVSKDQIGGTAFAALAAGTDYQFNASSDGTGADLTSFFTVTSSTTSAGVRFTIKNNGSSAGFITKLQQRGKPIFRGEIFIDKIVPGKFGEQTLELDMPFQSNANVGKDVADYLSSTLSQAYPNLPPVRFLASRDSAHLHAAFEREPGDRIAFSVPVLGITGREFTINSVRLEFSAEGLVWCVWGLEPATTQRFWMVGVVGSGEIGINTFFGF